MASIENLNFNKELDFKGLQKAIDNLCSEYKMLKPFNIGKSCRGREISALRLGNSADFALICAATHGSEHITTNVLLLFLNELCFALKNDVSIAGLNARKAFFGRGLVVIPRVNPDGCEIAIKGEAACGEKAGEIRKMCMGDFTRYNANFRGVDINHNFDAGYLALKKAERVNGIFGPSASRYGGAYPESEPETAALCSLCRNMSIRQLLSLHSQGEVIYWNYGKNKPRRSEKMAEIMASSAGYALDVPLGIATGGGFKDWFIDTFNRPAFTVELGVGKNPLPIKLSGEIYLRVREMLTLFSIM